MTNRTFFTGAALALGCFAQLALAVTSTPDATSGFLKPAPGFSYTWTSLSGRYVRVTKGTKALEATIAVGTQTRRYVVLRPDPAPASAPVLLMLHPRDTAPEDMANLSNVVDFVATQGFWAVMPQAIGGKWQSAPSEGSSDVQFISALIDALAKQGVDKTRVSAAGYSSGGMLAIRLACELPAKIAATGIVAATMNNEMYQYCAPTVARSKMFFLGTNDPITPYYGVSGYGSAANMMQFWKPRQGCAGVVSTTLPNAASDNTTVQLDNYTGCSTATQLKLYTVNGGEHTWPGGNTSSTGVTTQDVSATGLIWLMAKASHL